ncbi:MAG: hypothetical protein ACFB50_13100 [Rubrobacteraceae bacterium]
MDLAKLYSGSFIDWETVAGSFRKRTIPSRLMIFSARRYLEGHAGAVVDSQRRSLVDPMPVPDEIKEAFSAPPDPEAPPSDLWGEFVDAALATELEMVSYGERPPLLYELRTGLEAAAFQAGTDSDFGRWFLARRDALPGGDLPEDTGYIPI